MRSSQAAWPGSLDRVALVGRHVPDFAIFGRGKGGDFLLADCSRTPASSASSAAVSTRLFV